MLTMSTGYFIYDSSTMWWLKILDSDTLLHHTLVIAAFMYSLLINAGTFYNCLACVAGECSNPFLQIRGMIRSLNMKYTKLFDFA